MATDMGPRVTKGTWDHPDECAEIPRFNNQTIRPITVKEHSMRVRRIVRELAGREALLDAERHVGTSASRHYGVLDAQLWALLHDAHEALVPWGDCLGPGKTPEMRAVEAAVDEVIGVALNLPGFSDGQVEVVRTADAIALYFEAMLWQPGARDWAPGVFPDTHEITGGGVRPRPSYGELIERFMPLIAPHPGECWRTEVEALLA